MTRATITRSVYVNDASGLPAWYTAQTAGTWKVFTGSELSASGEGWPTDITGNLGGGDTSDYKMVVRAWGGGVLNTVGLYVDGAFVPGAWLVIFGGGHGDYAGNELYAWGPLNATSPAWHRLNDPTEPAPENVARLGGYPVSRHTYDTLVYLPTENKMIAIGAPGYFKLGSGFAVTDLFDFAVNPATTNPWSTGPDLGSGSRIGAHSAYNPDTGVAWSLGGGNGNALYAYDVAGGTITRYSKDNPLRGGTVYGTGAILPADNVYVEIDGNNEVQCIDLRTPTSAIYHPTTSGTGPTGRVALDWDSANGRIVARAGNGKTIWFLTPPANPYSGGGTWVWTSNTPAGGDTPGSVDTYGPFGRFRVVNANGISGAVLMPDYNVPMAFYKF